MLLIQINEKSTFKGVKRENAKQHKELVAATLNYQRNWRTYAFDSILDFYQILITELKAFRLAIKENGNKKDSIKECYGLGLDLDLESAKVSRTLKFVTENDLSYILYYSPSGDPKLDCTNHRLLLFFDKPQTVEITEKYSKYLSWYLQDKSICGDAGRLWFPPLEDTVAHSKCQIGKGLENFQIPADFDAVTQSNETNKAKNEKLKTVIKSDSSIRGTINSMLCAKALEIGFDNLLSKLDISDVTFTVSKREGENGTIDGDVIARWDIKPPKSDCKDRVVCHQIDDKLYFYDRRDGSQGYSGSFLLFLLKASGESDISYKSQLDYAYDILPLLGLQYPSELQNIQLEASLLWYNYLSDNQKEIIYISDSQKYGYFNGVYWELFNPETFIDTIFVRWCIANYGIIKSSLFKNVKKDLKYITFDIIRNFKSQPIDRHLYPFKDCIFDIEKKNTIPFSENHFIWYTIDFKYSDYNPISGLNTYNNLVTLVRQIIVGDDDKKLNFLNGFNLLVHDALWRTQSMLWLYGDGGSGKSTLINWVRDMLAPARDNGRVADLRYQELFDSPHSMQKIVQGTIINLSEFSFPSNKDSAFLKDMITSGSLEASTRNKIGCAIPINEKFKTPYTAYWIGSIVATSQNRPNNDCILDTGWQRRLNYFNFRKIQSHTNLYSEIDSNIYQLFCHILMMNTQELIDRYNQYFKNPNPENEQQLELELSPVAMYLDENADISDENVPIRQLYHDFMSKKAEYGYTYNMSVSGFEKYLSRYLSKFHNSSIFIHKKVKCCNLCLRKFSRKSVTLSNEDQNGFNFSD